MVERRREDTKGSRDEGAIAGTTLGPGFQLAVISSIGRRPPLSNLAKALEIAGVRGCLVVHQAADASPASPASVARVLDICPTIDESHGKVHFSASVLESKSNTVALREAA